MTYRFQLKYDKRFAGPATIVLKTSMTDGDGNVCITPDCFSMLDLDSAIDGLVAELQSIRADARSGFAYQPKRLYANHADPQV
jgi:hypothetical protein